MERTSSDERRVMQVRENGNHTEQESGELLDIDSVICGTKFDRVPFVIEHHLSGHPLFELDRLLSLAKSLPASHVEFNSGKIDISCDPEKTPRTGLSASETVRRIRECESWMALKNVEHDADYAALLGHCLEEVARHTEAVRPGMHNAEAFIFLSSPRSVTPYHMDPEHNFLLQIRGNKNLTVFDQSVTSAQELERFHCGAHRNMRFDDTRAGKGTTFELLPGQGLHIPSLAPHYVRNGDDVSISFSITFRTPDQETRGLVYQANHIIRSFGLEPAPVGSSSTVDQLKAASYRIWRKSNALVGRHV
jgi:hypothetical protein